MSENILIALESWISVMLLIILILEIKKERRLRYDRDQDHDWYYLSKLRDKVRDQVHENLDWWREVYQAKETAMSKRVCDVEKAVETLKANQHYERGRSHTKDECQNVWQSPSPDNRQHTA